MVQKSIRAKVVPAYTVHALLRLPATRAYVTPATLATCVTEVCIFFFFRRDEYVFLMF